MVDNNRVIAAVRIVLPIAVVIEFLDCISHVKVEIRWQRRMLTLLQNDSVPPRFRYCQFDRNKRFVGK